MQNTRTFSHLIEQASSCEGFYAAHLPTPLGEMVAIADDTALYLLEFIDRTRIERQVRQLREKKGLSIVEGQTPIHASIEKELSHYFEGTLTTFKTPISLVGSPFQKRVWEALRKIPYGETCSYTQLAVTVGNAKAFRAVAQANGANRMALVIPCHRVVNANGALGGYAGGLDRKSWLLQHEQECLT